MHSVFLYFQIVRKDKHYQESMAKLQNVTSNHINAIGQIRREIIMYFSFFDLAKSTLLT